jgi:hypothetical protein
MTGTSTEGPAGQGLLARPAGSHAELALAALIGFAVFVLVVGSNPLYVSNIAWLDGDRAQHYLGWAFFRQSGWSWPPGVNPDYGLEIASSVTYSDSIPLLAIPFKAFASLLPQPFQYFGLWLLGCYVLQAVLGWKLAETLGLPRPARLLAAGLIAFAPPFIQRSYFHFALAGHWLLLGGLCLYARRSETAAPLWALLCFAAALVHPYLLAMILALALAELLQRLLLRQTAPLRASGFAALCAAGAGAGLWVAGFFQISSGLTGGGFGFYRMDMFALVDSTGWSYLLPDIPDAPGEYEGFNFLGLGGLVLLGASLAGALARGGVSIGLRWLPMAAMSACLTLVALSGNVSGGPWELGHDPLVGPARILRASGRMFWPVFYCILVASIVLTVRIFGARAGTWLLAAALALQVADTSPAWTRQRRFQDAFGGEWPLPVRSAFWAEAAKRYQKIRKIPVASPPPEWHAIGYFAVTHGMATDAVYLARVDAAKLEDFKRKTESMLDTGNFEPDSLYVLDPDIVPRVRPHVGEGDLLAQVENIWVLAKGGADLMQYASPP